MRTTPSLCIILLSAILLNGKLSAKEHALIQQKVIVQIELPAFEKKHQNPYFALWLSRANNENKALVVVRQKVKWLRDLKKFWRSIARENRAESDAVTGATNKKKKFNYEFILDEPWDSISLEVAREHGKKEVISLPISIEKKCSTGKLEIENICVQITNHQR
ncbi:DUF2271 domain-containing protein [Cognaticolwellia mytili]|uniref:DUF2271 domain-containing protein n=1 Tax=Cognaticolwellia mytili TaxID=1888913 RepID=UPI000A173729|nr:DUF2271 domain-containing protein [Cognaticolwellia mytili]